MKTIPDRAACLAAANGAAAGLVPINPFTSLRFHFGMLLGVDDLEVAQAYPRGKMRLHNAWLHGSGVVWGFDVTINERRELQVGRGLAIDTLGHELHLETDACCSLPAWFEEHRQDANLGAVTVGDTVRFDAHIVVRFQACLTRPVPAMSEPCQNDARDTAYSRVFETVEILLRPGRAPTEQPTPSPYRRLRLLFGHRAPDMDGGAPVARDQEVLGELDAIAAEPAERQPLRLLAAFRRFAALDVIELSPATDSSGETPFMFPVAGDGAIALADIEAITLQRSAEGWTFAAAAIDRTIRRSIIPTTTIQELLCSPCCDSIGSSGGGGVREGAFESDAVVVNADRRGVTLTASAPMPKERVRKSAFHVFSHDERSGWTQVPVRDAKLDRSGTQVRLTLGAKLGGSRVRVVARDTRRNGTDFVVTKPLQRR